MRRGSAAKKSWSPHDLVRRGPDGGGHLARVLELAERALAKATEKVCSGRSICARHDGGDGAAVDAARQEHAERHVGHQAQAHRFLEQRAEARHEPASPAACGSGGVRALVRHVPVLPTRTAPFSKTSRCPGSSLRMPWNSVSSPAM
jgi:hypothetical protein